MDMIATRRIRLLYVAPERLAAADTIDMLRRMRAALAGCRRSPLRFALGTRFSSRLRPDRRNRARDRQSADDRGHRDAAPGTRADIERMLFRRPPRISCIRSDGRTYVFRSAAEAARADRRGERGARSRGRSGIVYCGSGTATSRWLAR